MDCTNCGACCVGQIIPLTALERGTTPLELMDGNGNLKSVDGHCILFDPKTRSCTDYEHRPQICRDFKSGCDRCVVMRAFGSARLGMGPEPIPTPVADSAFADFAVRLHLEEDGGRIRRISHPEPDAVTQAALLVANEELQNADGY